MARGQSYPAAEVDRYLREPGAESDDEITEEQAIQTLAETVDTTDVIREGSGADRLKIGITEGNTVQRIAAQITTSTPDRQALVLEIKTDTCRALERAIHGVLESRGRKS